MSEKQGSDDDRAAEGVVPDTLRAPSRLLPSRSRLKKPGLADPLAPGGVYLPDIIARRVVTLLEEAAATKKAVVGTLGQDPLSMLLREQMTHDEGRFRDAAKAIEDARAFAEERGLPLVVDALHKTPRREWRIAAIPEEGVSVE